VKKLETIQKNILWLFKNLKFGIFIVHTNTMYSHAKLGCKKYKNEKLKCMHVHQKNKILELKKS
jgi:hypothetical protein